MKCVNYLMLLWLCVFTPSVSLNAHGYQNERDSLESSVSTLQEIVIDGESVIRKNNSITLFPNKRDKKFASGGLDVLANMNIPDVIVNPLNNEVRASDGEAVSLFIDFQSASVDQMRTIRPQDIERIDIIHSPSDPRFKNARVVANFVMKKYQYGGYTKLNVAQLFPTSKGSYELYSKLSYKRMIYDVKAGMTNSYLGNNCGEEDYSTFRFTSGEVDRLSQTYRNKKRTISPYVSGRAIYNTSNISIANTVGFNYSRIKPNEQTSKVDFSDIFSSSESLNIAAGVNKGASWYGSYWFRMPDNSSLYFNGGFNWTNNSDNSTYRLSSYDPIVNDISEEVLAANGALNYSKRIGNHSIGCGVAGGWTRNMLDYLASDVSAVYYREGYGQAGVSADLSFDKFMISPSVNLSVSSENINDNVSTRWLPKAFMPFYLQFSQRSALSGSVEYAKGAIAASYRSPVLVRSNEVEAIRGNENLSDYDIYNFRLGYNHYFGHWLNASLDLRYSMEDNIMVPRYNEDKFDNGLPVMVTDIVNDGMVSRATFALTLMGEYFDRKLQIAISGNLRYFSQSGEIKRDKWHSDFYINAIYYLGSFRINAYYSPKVKSYSAWYDLTTTSSYFISGSWSWNDLYVDLRFSKTFRRSYVAQVSEFNSDKYTDRHVYKAPSFHQNISLTISYSFGYGKKVDHRSEVSKVSEASSIILKKK